MANYIQKGNLMSKYVEIHYFVDSPEPSEIYLKARSIAGTQLQEQFAFFNNKNVNSSYDGFKWIKAELSYPSFDNLTFAFKNSIFSLVIELIDNTGSSFSQNQKVRLLKACDENNLIPCLFKVNLQVESKNVMHPPLNKSVQKDLELIPAEKGWNLIDARTNDKISPQLLATEELTKMSNWELNNFAIQIVRKDIENEGNAILSFCDLLEINPQIWFEDKLGNMNWVVVRHITSKSDLNYREWVGLEKNNPQLIPYDGFFASVQFFSLSTNSATTLNRGDAMNVIYKGLERIYVS